MRKARSVAWFSTAGFHHRIEVRHAGSCSQVESSASSLERKHEKPNRLIFLEAAHELLAFFYLGLSVQNQPGVIWINDDRTKTIRAPP